MRLLNVKVPDDLRALVAKAAEVSGAPNMSAWAREALEAGATRELAEHTRSTAAPPEDDGSPTQPPTRPAVRGVSRDSNGRVLPSGCQHPPTARWIGVESESCTLCGAVVRSRM